MALAMEARAYHSGRKRIKLHKGSIKLVDIIFLLVTLAAFIFIVLL